MNDTNEKPIPEWMHEQRRIIELMDAITDRLQSGQHQSKGGVLALRTWSNELTRRLKKFIELLNLEQARNDHDNRTD